MCKAIQHFLAFADALHGQPVIFLIEEKSGFLSVHDIDHIVNAILDNFHIGIKFFADKAFDLCEPFFLAFICIASFVDTTDGNTIFGKNLF